MNGYSRGLLCLSFLAFGSCTSAAASPLDPGVTAMVGDPDSGKGIIQGTVKNSNTDAPIENALVVLSCVCLPEQREMWTNARGIYSFKGLPAGNYTIQVLAGKANVSKIAQLPGGAKFRANFAFNPGQDQAIEIVIEAAPVPSNTAAQMTIGMEEAKQLPVGANTSRDFTAVVDLAPTGSRDAAGVSLAGTTGSEAYAEIEENRFEATADAAISTFSIDVDTASYSNVRRFLRDAMLPPADAVRTEELLNYFSYDYPQPKGKDPFSITTEVGECPWNANSRLVHVGLRGQDIAADKLPPRNLVFLLDVSGSMGTPDKLPLLKRAMKLLVANLGAADHVAIVVYAGASGVVLRPTSGADQATILAALDRLEAGGSTNGAAGIELAYELARQHFDGKAINRVILATDGDFNVGTTSERALQKLIERERESGVFLSVLGLGTGNIKDSTMEMLADKGNGNYAYIDSLAEARKVLVEEAGATLVTIAKDVKIQVEFDPKQVASYRLVGYENRMLAAQDFDDDRKDAGEIGAGHSVTALYEVVLTTQAKPKQPLAELRLRYKQPSESKSKLLRESIVDGQAKLAASSDDFRFAAAVAEFAMLLRRSPQLGTATWTTARALAVGALGQDPGGYRAEFITLLDRAKALANP